jgi:hypothetical protein
VWSAQPYRATRDLALLYRGDGPFEAIRTDLPAVCATKVSPDAVVFDTGAIRIEEVRADCSTGDATGVLRHSTPDVADRPRVWRCSVACAEVV